MYDFRPLLFCGSRFPPRLIGSLLAPLLLEGVPPAPPRYDLAPPPPWRALLLLWLPLLLPERVVGRRRAVNFPDFTRRFHIILPVSS